MRISQAFYSPTLTAGEWKEVKKVGGSNREKRVRREEGCW